MNPQDISNAKDCDLRGSFAALQRAAASARQTAIQTNTGIAIVKDGQLVIIEADALRQEQSAEDTEGR